MMNFPRAAWVIARRDFVASVYSRSFFFFLLSPLVILGISVMFGSVTQNAAREDTKIAVAVLASEQQFQALAAARDQLTQSLPDQMLPEFVRADPAPDEAAQVKALLGSNQRRIVAVLSRPFEHPVLTGPISASGSVVRQMALVVDEARQGQALARAGIRSAPVNIDVARVDESAGALATTRALTARAGQLLLFMLTVLLAGMLLSNMIEEKSNKVIEVLAAAVPVDAIFVGKIFAMLAVSLVGVAVWGGGGLLVLSIRSGIGGALPAPAVGWPMFVLFVLVYFSANYLLLGALFLGIGSQANSVREVQTLSMPVTVGQMLIFLFAQVAMSHINEPIGIAAAVFPFSSPLTMVARAGEDPGLWPHLLALVWQGIWVWLTVSFGARMFRRNVLKSGGASPRFRKRKAVRA